MIGSLQQSQNTEREREREKARRDFVMPSTDLNKRDERRFFIYENEWKKAKTPRSELESTWKKKKGEQTKGIEFPHFSNTLKLHALHTHTQQKNTLNHVPIYASYWQSAFFFSFSFRFASWHWLERDARILFLEKMGIIIAACVGDDCIKIDRFKKKRNLNPHSTTLYLSKRVQKRSKRIPRSVFRTFRMDLLGIRFRATQYARGKDGIVRKRRFFVFRECNPRQHLEARLDTFFQKKKKRTDPFTSSFSHTKNIIYDS